MITADDVLQIIRCRRLSSIEVWRDGGWGVDALVGEQTRAHNDRDIVVCEDAVARLRDELAPERGMRSTGQAVRHRLPAVYPVRGMVEAGGLMV